jgi:hypothetical protein
MESFYNTINIAGTDLNNQKQKAMTQTQIVMEFFRHNPKRSFTPFEVCQAAFNNSCPVTSVRRAITVLEKEGLLIKLTERRNGDYGVLNHLWKFRPVEQENLQITLF